MGYQTEPDFAHGTPARTGILLVNLGTPDAPTAKAVRPYLKEFLGDPRVVEIPRAIWWLILNGIILNTRPKKSAAKYAAIWMPEGSPLRVHSAKQTVLLQGYLGQRTRAPFVVDYAMRYGSPSVPSVLRKLKQQNCQRILVVPMYPQYAASSTGTAFDSVFREVLHMRNAPALRTIKNFHDNAGYIKALASNINDYWMKNGRPEKLVMSFHGLPQFSLDKGDPYHCECHKTGACWRRNSACSPGNTRSASSRASARRNGSSPTPPPHSRNWANTGPDAWTWSAPASLPIAWKRWKRSRWKARKISCRRAGANTITSPASTSATTGCTR